MPRKVRKRWVDKERRIPAYHVINQKRQMIAPSMTAFLARAMGREPRAIWPFEQFMRVLINNPKVLEESEPYIIKFPNGKFTWYGVLNAVCNHLADDNPEWFGFTEYDGWMIRAWFNNVWFRDFGVNITPISQPRLWQVTQARNRVIREFEKSEYWKNTKDDFGFPPHYFKIVDKKKKGKKNDKRRKEAVSDSKEKT